MLVFELGDLFYIEVFETRLVNQASGINTSTTHTLERAGTLIGYATGETVNNNMATDKTAIMSLTASTIMPTLPALNFTSFVTRLRQNTGGALTWGMTVILLMRRPAR